MENFAKSEFLHKTGKAFKFERQGKFWRKSASFEFDREQESESDFK